MSTKSFPKPGLYDLRNFECMPIRDDVLEVLYVAYHTETEEFDEAAHIIFRVIGNDGLASQIYAHPWKKFLLYFAPRLAPVGTIEKKIPEFPPVRLDTVYPPLPGFYYHYKNIEARGPFNYAYEVLTNIHLFGGNENGPADFVLYRPLYESARVYQAGKHCDLRPREMFLEDVEGKDIGGATYSGPRFNSVKDEARIALLKEQAEKMYGK